MFYDSNTIDNDKIFFFCVFMEGLFLEFKYKTSVPYFKTGMP